MLYTGDNITLGLQVLCIDDIKGTTVIGHYLRQQGVINASAPDPYFTLVARNWDTANQALRYPPPVKWDALFLDNHLDVDRHDDHIGLQLCEWLRSNPYFLPREVFFISFDGKSDMLMFDTLSKVYMNGKVGYHLWHPITEI